MTANSLQFAFFFLCRGSCRSACLSGSVCVGSLCGLCVGLCVCGVGRERGVCAGCVRARVCVGDRMSKCL